MEHQHKEQKQTSLLQLWARAPAKQRQTVLVGTASRQSSDKLQGYTSKDNKENMDPKKDPEVLAKVCVPEAFCGFEALSIN
ncbi:TPA: hypothetical protein ACH3X1_004302 [Trebouxia sp. C0004]